MILPGLLARLTTRPPLASRVLAPPLAQVVLGVDRLGLRAPARGPVVVGVWEAEPDDPEAELLDEAEGWLEELGASEDVGTRDERSVNTAPPPTHMERPARRAAPMREATVQPLSQPPPSAPRQPPRPPEPPRVPPVEGATDDEDRAFDQPAPPHAARLDPEGPADEVADRPNPASTRVEPTHQAPRLRGLAAPELTPVDRAVTVEQARPGFPSAEPVPDQPQATGPVESPRRLAESTTPTRRSPNEPPRGPSRADVAESAAPPGGQPLDDTPTPDIQPAPPTTRAAPPADPQAPTEADLPSSAIQPAESAAPAPPVTRETEPNAGIHATPEAPAPRRPRPEMLRPRPQAPEPPRLFEPVEGDRSPASWLARLRQAESAPEGAAERPETTTTPSTSPDSSGPEPSTAHTAVRPLPTAGIAAPQTASAPQAPARPPSARPRTVPPAPTPPPVTVQAIASSARPWLEPIVGYDPTGTPVVTGAAATSAARRLSADAFAVQGVVVLAGAPEPSAPRTAGLLAHELSHLHPQRRVSPAAPAPPSSDEEQAARVAETTATLRAARAAPALHAAPRPEPWGELPAPWEPLPDWLTAPRAAEGPLSLAPPAPRPAIAASPPPPAPAPALAATDRPAAEPALAAEAPQPAPDLDELARQVYGRLKRRLLLERRRGASEGSP